MFLLGPIDVFVLTWDIRQIGHRRQRPPPHRWPLCSNTLRHLRLPETTRQVKPMRRPYFDTDISVLETWTL